MPKQLTDLEIYEMAEALRSRIIRPSVKFEEAMQILGYQSKGAVMPIFKRMESIGILEHVVKDNKAKGEWYFL